METAQSFSDLDAIIDGKAIAASVRERVANQVAVRIASGHQAPGLATILIGDDAASAIYVAAKRRACAEVGIVSHHFALPGDVTLAEVLTLIDTLNADPGVSGILCQLPLPAHLDAQVITNRIIADKDVDGLTISNAGRLALGMPGLRPCTPAGVMVMLEASGVSVAGRHAVVIGRSNLFGKPMAQMLLAANATVTSCHRQTIGLRKLCRDADILIAAAGRPEMVRADWIQPGAVVIDVGINRTERGLVGDVAFAEVRQLAAAITPVPGGVGPMTIAQLLQNTVEASLRTDG